MEQTEKDSNVVVKDMLQILHLPKVETFLCGSMAYFNGMEDYNEYKRQRPARYGKDKPD